MKKFYLILTVIFFFINYLNAQDTVYIDISPGKGMDVESCSISPDQNYEPRYFINTYAWTIGGTLNISRGFLQFDLSSLPANCNLLEAKLFLYGTTLLNHSGENATKVTRITEPWVSTTLTHNNQPGYTNTDSAVIPTTTLPYQDVEVDVTAMTQYMVLHPSERYGYRLALVDETIYKIFAFCCSETTDPTKRPKLMLVTNGYTSVNQYSVENISISPNPVANSLKIEGFSNDDQISIQLFSTLGQLVYSNPQFDPSQTLDVSSIENGFYFMKMVQNGQSITKKVVIQK